MRINLQVKNQMFSEEPKWEIATQHLWGQEESEYLNTYMLSRNSNFTNQLFFDTKIAEERRKV